MAFLLGTFLTGGVLGFSADKLMRRDQVCTTKGVNPMVSRLASRLDLSATQQASFDSILDKRSEQYHQAMAPVRSRMDSIRQAAREQMRAVLNPQQRTEFEALLKEMSDSTKKENDDNE